eukprot:6742205-Prymnesium_polylepis.2
MAVRWRVAVSVSHASLAKPSDPRAQQYGAAWGLRRTAARASSTSAPPPQDAERSCSCAWGRMGWRSREVGRGLGRRGLIVRRLGRAARAPSLEKLTPDREPPPGSRLAQASVLQCRHEHLAVQRCTQIKSICVRDQHFSSVFGLCVQMG